MASHEYLLGYRAALRHLIEVVDAPGTALRKNMIVTKKTAEYLKVFYEHAFELAQEAIDLSNAITDKEEVQPSQILQGSKQWKFY